MALIRLSSPHLGELAHLVGAVGGFVADGGTGEGEEGVLQRIGRCLLFQFGGSTLGDDLAMVDDGDAVGDAVGFL